jgi:hypothetical protein
MMINFFDNISVRVLIALRINQNLFASGHLNTVIMMFEVSRLDSANIRIESEIDALR